MSATPTHTVLDTFAWASTLHGVAYGDAHGYPTEFASYQGLVDQHGPEGPDAPDQLVVSDDTQMTLALARALTRADLADHDSIRDFILVEYLSWLVDPDNDRAPGGTCLQALRSLKDLTFGPSWDDRAGLPPDWATANIADSKGCGANMRVAPAAFLPDNLWEPVAAFQASLTHGHPTGVTAAITTAYTIRAAGSGTPAAGLLTDTRRFVAARLADTEAPVWAAEWLPGVAEHAGYADLTSYLHAGWVEVAGTLDRAASSVDAFRYDPWDGDVCDAGGDGWVADEALATALVCVSLFPDDPEQVIRRSAVTGGDSDSISAIAGAIIGATDPDAWDADWTGRLEPRYAHALATLSMTGPV